MGPTVTSRHLGNLAKALAGSPPDSHCDGHNDQGRDGGAESGHPNPSGGVQEGFLDEDDCVETHEISDGLARGKDGG